MHQLWPMGSQSGLLLQSNKENNFMTWQAKPLPKKHKHWIIDIRIIENNPFISTFFCGKESTPAGVECIL